MPALVPSPAYCIVEVPASPGRVKLLIHATTPQDSLVICMPPATAGRAARRWLPCVQGHYVPAVAHRVYRSNELGEGPYINLKGLAIGNGLTMPAIQVGALCAASAPSPLRTAAAAALLVSRGQPCRCGRCEGARTHGGLAGTLPERSQRRGNGPARFLRTFLPCPASCTPKQVQVRYRHSGSVPAPFGARPPTRPCGSACLACSSRATLSLRSRTSSSARG